MADYISSSTAEDGSVIVSFDRDLFLEEIWAKAEGKIDNLYAEPAPGALGVVGYRIKDKTIFPFGQRHEDEIQKMDEVGPDADRLTSSVELICGSYASAAPFLRKAADALWTEVDRHLDKDVADLTAQVMPDIEFYNLCIRQPWLAQMAKASPFMARLMVEREPRLSEEEIADLLRKPMDEQFKYLVEPRVKLEKVTPALRHWLKRVDPADAPLGTAIDERRACWVLAAEMAKIQDQFDPNLIQSLTDSEQMRLVHMGLVVGTPEIALAMIRHPQIALAAANEYFPPIHRARFTSQHRLFAAFCSEIRDYKANNPNEALTIRQMADNSHFWHDQIANDRLEGFHYNGKTKDLGPFPEPIAKEIPLPGFDITLYFLGESRILAGAARRMRNCAATYAERCAKGEMLIYLGIDAKDSPVLLASYEPNGKLQQASGMANGQLSDKVRRAVTNALLDSMRENQAKSAFALGKPPKVNEGL